MLRAARHRHPFVYPVLIPGLSTNRHNIEYTPDQVLYQLTDDMLERNHETTLDYRRG